MYRYLDIDNQVNTYNVFTVPHKYFGLLTQKPSFNKSAQASDNQRRENPS